MAGHRHHRCLPPSGARFISTMQRRTSRGSVKSAGPTTSPSSDIDDHDISRAVEDKATVPIYYASRLARINAEMVRNGWALAFRRYSDRYGYKRNRRSMPAPAFGAEASVRLGSGGPILSRRLRRGTAR
jgi:hypothetical protein